MRSCARRAASIAATLVARRSGDAPPLTCVLGGRSADTFAAILGILASGHGYVPMLPAYPPSRLALMIERSQATTLVIDAEGAKRLDKVLGLLERPLTVLRLGEDELAPAQEWTPPQVGPDDIAYLLFTSGSTGQPKGVMVAHRNIERFLDVVIDRYGLCEEDRFSHMFEITFDLSLFDLFAPWTCGGCLCVPDGRQRLLPASYVGDAKLSVWFSVPSVAVLMNQTRTLIAEAFPGLRLSLFCGEALTVGTAQAWAAAASRSRIENIYGPTELTLACTHYRFEGTQADPADVVPIGDPFDGMRAKVVDEALREVAPGESGELIMAGPQVALGYWNDPEKTAAAFVTPPGESEIFYRTGDRVLRPEGEAPLRFLGRMDHQIKIRGHRVELGEIEAVLREEAAVQSAVALGWPVVEGGIAGGVVAFIDDASVDTKALIKRLGARLPRYMVPKQVRVIEEFPLNANGKIDRKALRAMLG